MDNKKCESLVRSLFTDVYSNNNKEKMSEKLKEYFSENVQLHDSAAPKFKGGIEGLKQLESMYLQAFPDKKLTIQDIVCTENRAVVRWTCSATHQGSFSGIAPTRNRITISGISEYEFSPSGKIQVIHQNWDRLALLEQIGALEPVSALH